jgi:secreted PhoX family phosphatase
MDRPEWCAVHPSTGEIYYTLTNNSNRKLEPTGQPVRARRANPRAYTDALRTAPPARLATSTATSSA